MVLNKTRNNSLKSPSVHPTSTAREANYIPIQNVLHHLRLSLLVFYITCNDISVTHMRQGPDPRPL